MEVTKRKAMYKEMIEHRKKSIKLSEYLISENDFLKAQKLRKLQDKEYFKTQLLKTILEKGSEE